MRAKSAATTHRIEVNNQSLIYPEGNRLTGSWRSHEAVPISNVGQIRFSRSINNNAVEYGFSVAGEKLLFPGMGTTDLVKFEKILEYAVARRWGKAL